MAVGVSSWYISTYYRLFRLKTSINFCSFIRNLKMKSKEYCNKINNYRLVSLITPNCYTGKYSNVSLVVSVVADTSSVRGALSRVCTIQSN